MIEKFTWLKIIQKENNEFNQHDLKILIDLIKNEPTFRLICQHLYESFLKVIGSLINDNKRNKPTYEVIDYYFVKLVIYLSKHESEGLLFRFVLLKHFELSKIKQPL